jgi:hypothetical protein
LITKTANKRPCWNAAAAGGMPGVDGGAARAWLRALEATAPIAQAPRRTFPLVIEELAAKFGDAPALSVHRIFVDPHEIAKGHGESRVTAKAHHL